MPTADEGTSQGPSKTVKFYFSYNSPYAFLANTRIAREVAPFDVTLIRRPIYSPRTGPAPDPTTPRMSYVVEDVARFAEAYGLDLAPGPFTDSRRACLAFFAADAAGHGVGFNDAIFRARWLDGKDIGADDVIAAAGDTAGLAGDALVASLGEARFAAALNRSNAEAVADRVFGVPTFVYGSERFWGNDRIEWLVRALQKRAA